jgi:selenophosphate synthase
MPGRGGPAKEPYMATEGQCDLLQLTEHCGCGAKLPAADLREILSGLPASRDPRLLAGPATFDDAAVYRLKDDGLLVQTVVVFPPVARAADAGWPTTGVERSSDPKGEHR